MKVLILDDKAERHVVFRRKLIGHELIHAYTYDEGIIEVNTDPSSFDVMFLDHDLSENSILCDPHTAKEPTGSTFAQHLADLGFGAFKPELGVFLHSLNPAGRVNMLNILRNAGFNCHELPFTLITPLISIKLK